MNQLVKKRSSDYQYAFYKAKEQVLPKVKKLLENAIIAKEIIATDSAKSVKENLTRIITKTAPKEISEQTALINKLNDDPSLRPNEKTSAIEFTKTVYQAKGWLAAWNAFFEKPENLSKITNSFKEYPELQKYPAVLGKIAALNFLNGNNENRTNKNEYQNYIKEQQSRILSLYESKSGDQKTKTAADQLLQNILTPTQMVEFNKINKAKKEEAAKPKNGEIPSPFQDAFANLETTFPENEMNNLKTKSMPINQKRALALAIELKTYRQSINKIGTQEDLQIFIEANQENFNRWKQIFETLKKFPKSNPSNQATAQTAEQAKSTTKEQEKEKEKIKTTFPPEIMDTLKSNPATQDNATKLSSELKGYYDKIFHAKDDSAAQIIINNNNNNNNFSRWQTEFTKMKNTADLKKEIQSTITQIVNLNKNIPSITTEQIIQKVQTYINELTIDKNISDFKVGILINGFPTGYVYKISKGNKTLSTPSKETAKKQTDAINTSNKESTKEKEAQKTAANTANEAKETQEEIQSKAMARIRTIMESAGKNYATAAECKAGLALEIAAAIKTIDKPQSPIKEFSITKDGINIVKVHTGKSATEGKEEFYAELQFLDEWISQNWPKQNRLAKEASKAAKKNKAISEKGPDTAIDQMSVDQMKAYMNSAGLQFTKFNKVGDEPTASSSNYTMYEFKYKGTDAYIQIMSPNTIAFGPNDNTKMWFYHSPQELNKKENYYQAKDTPKLLENVKWHIDNFLPKKNNSAKK
jgi:hypothetical protein